MAHTCKNCGRDYNGNFCPECGTPHKGLPRRSHAAVVAHNRSCGGGCLISFFILLGLFIVIALIAYPSGSDTSGSSPSAVSQSNAPSPTPTPVVISDPVKYSGSGDDVITIDPLPEGYVFYAILACACISTSVIWFTAVFAYFTHTYLSLSYAS